ncbi:MAG: tryptophan--tRNA ligase [Bacillota bacterium]
MQGEKGVIFSGMRPTGRLHIGNLLGALENWVRLQDEYHCFYCIVDWHAMTTDYENPGHINENVREMVMDWLSCGMDPEKSVVFRQSDVKEHAELHLLLSMVTPLSWLERCPTYKDQLQQIEGRNLATYGFIGYPVLQAADILLYKANAVPVGEDQAAHLELTREIVRRFNYIYGKKVFPEPETLHNEYRVVLGLDRRKMSKSYDNTIDIAAGPDEISQKVRMMITDPARIRKNDPGNPTICSVFAFHRIFNTEGLEEVELSCSRGEMGCVECKDNLSQILLQYLEPIHKRRRELENNPRRVTEILEEGRKKAQQVARVTMEEVRSIMGLQ